MSIVKRTLTTSNIRINEGRSGRLLLIAMMHMERVFPIFKVKSYTILGKFQRTLNKVAMNTVYLHAWCLVVRMEHFA